MFYRRPITKRIIAALGVVIALMGSFQQAHALCGLIGCGQREVEQDRCFNDYCQDACCRPDTIAAPSSICIDNQFHCPSPCPNDCWCCQEPSPQQVPTPISADSVGEIWTSYSFANSLAVEADNAARDAASFAIEICPQLALEVCARLCRFLT